MVIVAVKVQQPHRGIRWQRAEIRAWIGLEYDVPAAGDLGLITGLGRGIDSASEELRKGDAPQIIQIEFQQEPVA
jgi:hypothetical protein